MQKKWSFGGVQLLYDTRNTGMATDLINTSQHHDSLITYYLLSC